MASSRSNEYAAYGEYDCNSQDRSRTSGRRKRSIRSPAEGNLHPDFDNVVILQLEDTPDTIKDMHAILSDFTKSIVQKLKKGKMSKTSERGHEMDFEIEDFERRRNWKICINEPQANDGRRTEVRTQGRYDKIKGIMSSSRDSPYIPSRSSTSSIRDDLSFMCTPNCDRTKGQRDEFASTAMSREDKWFKKKLKQFGLTGPEKSMFKGNTCRNTASPFCKEITKSELPPRWRDVVMDRYTGKTNPATHIAEYLTKMQVYTYNESIACRIFPTTLGGDALNWFHELSQELITSF